MASFKKYGIPILAVIAGLLLNFLISILLHGYIMAPIEDPFTTEGITEVFEDQKGSVILDHLEDGDAALTLLQKEDGTVFLLEFHKNLILPRYQLMDVVHIVPEETQMHTAVRTVTRYYPVCVKDHQQLLQDGTVERGLQFGNFFLLYGMNTLLLLAAEYIVWRTGRNYWKNKKK